MCIYGSILPKKKTQICFLPGRAVSKMCIFGSILPKTKPRFFSACSGLCQQCVYMAAFGQKKKSPAAGCVKNVYIWHHFAQNRNKFVSPKILFPNWHRFQKSKEIFYSFKMCLYGINLCIWSLAIWSNRTKQNVYGWHQIWSSCFWR